MELGDKLSRMSSKNVSRSMYIGSDQPLRDLQSY